MPPTPTLVIGLGQAGCEMASAVNERAINEGIADSVEVLGIDSRPEDVERTLPDDAGKLVLDVDEKRFSSDREHRSYLGKTNELLPEGGTARQRPLGRYYLDNPASLDRTWTFLETHVEKFLSDVANTGDIAPVTEINVWIVNSLAGGTGSGAFPLVAGLVQELLTEIQATQGIEPTLSGVGSLLRLDRLDDQAFVPAGRLEHYFNAYVALSDLRVLVGESSASLSIHPDTTQFPQAELNVGGVFDRYLLAGIRNDDYRHLNTLDETIADAIYNFTIRTVNRLSPGQLGGGSGPLFSIDGSKISLPVETAEEYVELSEEIAAKRRDLTQLERDRGNATADREYLEAVLSLRRDELPAPDAPLERELVRRCNRAAENLAPELPSSEDTDERIDLAVADIREEGPAPIDGAFDATAVVRYLLAARLLLRVDRRCERAREDVRDFVRPFVDVPPDSLQQYIDGSQLDRLESDPLGAAEQIEQFLQHEHERLLERQEESQSIFADIFDTFDDFGTRIETVDKQINDLTDARSKFERQRAIRAEVQTVFDRSRRTLGDRRLELETDQHELDDQILECERDLENLEQRSEHLAADLSDPEADHQRYQVPIARPELLDEELLQRVSNGGLDELVDSELVEQETVEQAIRQACLDLEEPIQDQLTAQPSKSILAPVLAEENASPWMDLIQSAGTDAGFDSVELSVGTVDALSINLLGLYTDIDITATSEFGTLHEYVTDTEHDLADLFGSEIDDLSHQSVAYPELH